MLLHCNTAQLLRETGWGALIFFFSSLTVRNASYILRKSVRVCGLRISLLQEKKKKKSLV